ncbi:MAG: rhamnulokinase family protein [Phototrophicaceae bacterium]
MSAKSVLAVDLGAESGRVIQASLTDDGIALEDMHRFSNTPVYAGATLNWDVLRLWHNIQKGIALAGDTPISVGVDTWGVDFALLDKHGALLSNPVHYRDQRNDGMMDWVFERMPRREIFEQTGIQFMQINGLYGLAAMAKAQSPVLDIADTLLTIPDLFNYWLSGSKTCEFSHATTLQIYNPRQNDWARPVLEAVGIPTNFLTPVVHPGDIIGKYNHLDVIVPACHDTGSAVVGIPTTTKNYAYLSSGTWSLLGIEVDEPVINDASYEANLTNEGGVYGNYRLLKNIMGLWIAQQCRETWARDGQDYSYAQLVTFAEGANSFHSFIDPDHDIFLAHGDMPSRIRDYCKNTQQAIPETVGQIMRTVFESLAMKYRYVVDLLRDISGQAIERLHIIGGGAKNTLLCQMTANALGMDVVAGPVEATALGNAIIQFITQGEFANIAEAREMLSRTISTSTYEPQARDEWEEQYHNFKYLLDNA